MKASSACNCAQCGRVVRQDNGSDYIRAHLWTGTIVMHWRCFLMPMDEHERKRDAQGETARAGN